MASPQPRISARKFGRSFESFDTLSSASVGNRDLGKVKVDCRFRLSKSKWGVLGDAERSAGILYMDLCFDQPKDCRLSSATVLLTLDHEIGDDEKNRRREPASITRGSSLQMTDYFGPRQLSGKQTTVNMKSTYSLKPEINVMGNGVGGVGKDSETTREASTRWTFIGQLQPGQTGAYRTLKWELSENELDLQSLHSSVIHTGFTFEHDQTPCYLRVEITGKLQSRRDRFRKSLFPAQRSKNQGKTIVRIDLGPQHRFDTRLDSLADGLARAMEMENYGEIPVEIPEAIPAFFQEAGNHQSQPAAISNLAPPASLEGSRIGRIDLTPEQPPMLAAPIAEDPLIKDLARAHLYFPSRSNNRWRVPESRSASSTATLVENEEQSDEISVASQDARNGELELKKEPKEAVVAIPAMQDLVKTENEEVDAALETFMRISQSPAIMFLIHVFVGFLDLFARKGASEKKII
ncbi:hypothetical protein V494_03582 [Pseudogymnoascus sp. VKM F-4513 (FW-928)]|nr:hypothetical protein V494_03582 [Pseudogymnoascus sp. VKM F-4513 (FW-928)]